VTYTATVSRRGFLSATGAAVAGTVLGARQLRAGHTVVVPANTLLPADAFLGEIARDADMAAMARHAVDAARSAGAVYADVRIAENHVLRPSNSDVFLEAEFTFGVRARVDGVWGFAYGRVPTTDAVARCAVEAVSAARMTSRLGRAAATDPWTPPPLATGEWTTPVRIDPFTVPIRQQAERINAAEMAVGRVAGSFGGFSIEWTRERRVMAATTGTLVTQQFYRASPYYYAFTRYGRNFIRPRVTGLHGTSQGYELLLAENLLDRFAEATEEANRLARLPVRSMDVGRYPFVADGAVTGTLLLTLLSQSLELDRVLGWEADASGTSRMTPELLGTVVTSPLMTVRAHRRAPAIRAARWDDEGSETREHTLLRNGVLVDFHTSAETVPALRQWYARNGQSLLSNGCAVATRATTQVGIQPPHLVLESTSGNVSLDDLCKEVQTGVLVITDSYIQTDQQLASGNMNWMNMYEIARGKIVRKVQEMQLQFNTAALLKGVVALGGQSTVRDNNVSTSKSVPWVNTRGGATAPAVLFKEINVVSSRLS
jgi:TldD protein